MPDTIPQWLMMGPLHDMMQAVRAMYLHLASV
jgi:hypothetical protein